MLTIAKHLVEWVGYLLNRCLEKNHKFYIVLVYCNIVIVIRCKPPPFFNIRMTTHIYIWLILICTYTYKKRGLVGSFMYLLTCIINEYWELHWLDCFSIVDAFVLTNSDCSNNCADTLCPPGDKPHCHIHIHPSECVCKRTYTTT